MSPPASPAAYDAGDRWFWLWHVFFAVALVGDAALIVLTDAAGMSYASAALVLATAVTYLGYRNRLRASTAHSRPHRVFAATLAGTFVAACALDPDAGYALFALVPMIFMALRLAQAAVLTSLLIATPTLATIAHYGVDRSELGFQLPIIGMLMVGSALIGYWLDRIIEQSEERAVLIRELEASRAEVAALSHEAGVTAERERLAGEIHDTLAQGFTSVLTLVQAAQSTLGGDIPDAVHRHLELAARTARENLTEARALIAALTPSALGTGSLSDALRRLLDDTGQQSCARVEYLPGEQVRVLPTPVEVVLLRTAQEALANARKHSGATTVSLGLSTTDDVVRMVVTDDGCGFDRELVRAGYGLDGMRSRAAQVGGTVDIHSGPGEGTRVRLDVPL